MPGTNLSQVAQSVIDILTQACAAVAPRHRVSVCLTVFVSMVHCRTPLGAWKHAQRSYKRGYASRPPGFYGGDILPPPAPPFSFGVEFSGIRNHSDWNDLCDESEEWVTLETNCPTETICPTGAVTDFLELLDAPFAAKDISWPAVLCLTDLLAHESVEPESETVVAKPLASLEYVMEQPSTDGIILEQPSTNGDIGKMRPAVLSELRELRILVASMRADADGQLENLQQEYKKDLASMGDRISAALIEKLSSFNALGNEMGVLSQSGSSNIEKGFNWNPEAVVFSPLAARCGTKPEEFHIGEDVGYCATALDAVDEDCLAGPGLEDDANGGGNGVVAEEPVLSQSGGLPHRESASDRDFFEVVYSNQSRMKKYCFNCSKFNRDMHDVMFCFQLQLKKYRFLNSNACMLKRQEQVLSDLMNDECMNPNAEEADMLRWLNPNARFPFARNCFSGDSDGFSFLPSVLSQNGNGPLASD